MLTKILNRILMSMKKTPKTECDMVLGVRNSCQKNRISALPRQIFSKNYQILAILPVFCNFRIFLGSFSQIKAKNRVCHEKLMKIDPKNVQIGPLEPIFENRLISCFSLTFDSSRSSRRHGLSKQAPPSAAAYS